MFDLALRARPCVQLFDRWSIKSLHIRVLTFFFHKISSLTRVTQTGHPWTVVQVTDQEQTVLLRCPPRFWAFSCTCRNIGKTVFSIPEKDSSKINTGDGNWRKLMKCMFTLHSCRPHCCKMYTIYFYPCLYVVKTSLGYKNVSISFEAFSLAQNRVDRKHLIWLFDQCVSTCFSIKFHHFQRLMIFSLWTLNRFFGKMCQIQAA